MTRIFLTSVAALALLTGAAMAQADNYSESTTAIHSTVTPAAPSVESTSQTTRTKTLNSDGSETYQSKTYDQSSGGAVRETEHSRTFAPDGSEVTSTTTQRTTTPGIGETTTRSTTTTVDR